MIEDLTINIQASIDGKAVTDIDLLRFEVERSRVALLLLKTRIGPKKIAELLREETARSTALFARWAAASNGEFTASTLDVTVKGGSAKGFLAWFGRSGAASEEASLLGGMPEHYLVQGGHDGQDVIETIGGWGLPAHFHIDFQQDAKELIGPGAFDDAYPLRMTGVGAVGAGVKCGAVIHQFAETDGGFKAKLAIYYPRASDPAMVKGHRTHLALEFTNWINMYLAEEGVRATD